MLSLNYSLSLFYGPSLSTTLSAAIKMITKNTHKKIINQNNQQPISGLFHQIQCPPKINLPPNDGIHHVMGSIRCCRGHVLTTLCIEACGIPSGMSGIRSTRSFTGRFIDNQFITEGASWGQFKSWWCCIFIIWWRISRREYLSCRSSNQLFIQYCHRGLGSGSPTWITTHAIPSVTIYTQKVITMSLQSILEISTGITVKLWQNQIMSRWHTSQCSLMRR